MRFADFPRQYARTHRFSLGVPEGFVVSADGERVVFLRSASGCEARRLLWLHERGGERLLLDPASDPVGVSGFAADRRAARIACVVGGELWLVAADGGTPSQLPTPGPVRDARPSPDGALIAYVSGQALRVITADGVGDRPLAVPEHPEVSYGLADPIAVASIGRSRGFWWSPTGDALLVARTDTAPVARWHLADPAHPERPPRVLRYSAAGTPTADVSLHLVTLGGASTPVRLPRTAGERATTPGRWRDPRFAYLVTADWDAQGPLVSVQSRDQRALWVLAVDPATGRTAVCARLADDAWVHVTPGTPARVGGSLVLPAVRGDTRTIRWGRRLGPAGLQVEAVLGHLGGRVLFTASREPTDTHVWSMDRLGHVARLTTGAGTHSAVLGGPTLVLTHAGPRGRTIIVRRPGEADAPMRVLAETPMLRPTPKHLVVGRRRLRGRLHLPSWHRRATGALPVLLCPYGGPGMRVATRASGPAWAVCQWFAEQGFAVLVIDGRGTPGRGVRWQEAIIGDRLGPVLDDQVDGLRAAASRCGLLDLSRVGIRGWSFGGYLAAGAVLRRPEVFHAAVAGAPPTDRRMYHAHGEERFLGHPDVTPHTYQCCSLLPDAAALRRPLMLVHGLADENVFALHTLRLSAALLAAGRPHTVLLLPACGHRVTGVGRADTVLLAELTFLRAALAPRAG